VATTPHLSREEDRPHSDRTRRGLPPGRRCAVPPWASASSPAGDGTKGNSKQVDIRSVDQALRGFDAWMNGIGLGTLILGLLVASLSSPIFAFVHELGHAAIGLARTRG
jgi:hypothetical protein